MANYATSLVRSTEFFNNVDEYLGRMRFENSGSPRLVGLLAGGWSASSLFTYESGNWISFGACQVVKGGSPKLDNPTRDRWFDTSLFQRQPPYTERTNPKYYPGLTAPRQWNLDGTLAKYFQITERLRAELRMEAYNLTNSIMWSAPNMSVDSPLFGKVLAQSNRGRELQYTLRFHF